MCVWNYGGTPTGSSWWRGISWTAVSRLSERQPKRVKRSARVVPRLHALQTDFGEQVHGVFLTSWRGPEQVNFRWRHDLGRWGWNRRRGFTWTEGISG